jgi:tetratricopeptide (TPR) repeat protein
VTKRASANNAAARLKDRIVGGQQAYAAGDLPAAAEQWSSALRSAQRLPVSEDVRTTLRNNLAGVYQSLGNVALARRHYTAALADAEQRHGPDSGPVATILNNLAELERSCGNPAAAEPLFRKALSIAHEGDGSGLGILINTAQCLRDLGKIGEAAALNARAMEWAQRAGASEGALGVLWNNAAGLAADGSRWTEAIAAYEHAVTLLKKAGPTFSAQRKLAIRNFAGTLRRYAQWLETLDDG